MTAVEWGPDLYRVEEIQLSGGASFEHVVCWRRLNKTRSRRASVSKRLPLLGAPAAVLGDVKQQRQISDIEFFGGISVDDVRPAFGPCSSDSETTSLTNPPSDPARRPGYD
jgi:hypothetical protein